MIRARTKSYEYEIIGGDVYRQAPVDPEYRGRQLMWLDKIRRRVFRGRNEEEALRWLEERFSFVRVD